ncbi:MmgE/PrpD family protein [Mesorhizobium australafricanum]|uniref:MmgE/PrpD family protein n=1 Tax=Mesorhizobium australafricanum TaxID=3072311 RepID=A0ABU4X7I4_9HYPH|nr:MmgE/PrpD family protein [Mesorhizobium sp. VK3E]MDX8443928.1 MmgE/PrpD family protein [Mesorhizobium sp. VK3E]
MGHFAEFAVALNYNDIPEDVRIVMRRSFADIVGVATVGSTTEIAQITKDIADSLWRAAPESGVARMLFDGRPVSPAGAAFAGAFTIDAIDGHDGSSPCKGHAGSAIFPSLLAVADSLRANGQPPTGSDLMTALAAAYEVSYRAGLALHGTVSDYHTSGAWTAIGVAVGVGRLLKLDAERIRHAAGIAEYHGPRSQMMRCIDHPTMLRDGVGWGAPSGVMAAYMAKLGFTGAPAVTAEGIAVDAWWCDLGKSWRIAEDTHYKLYPVCRWAHPAIDAAQDLMVANGLSSSDVAKVRINTFHYAVRLAGHNPSSIDEMTYSIVFPVATMIARGKIGPEELAPPVLKDAEINRIAQATELVESEHYTRISVGKRWADVVLYLKDGRVLQSAPRTPKGDTDNPLTENELRGKYDTFTAGLLTRDRAEDLRRHALTFDSLDSLNLAKLFDQLTGPLDCDASRFAERRFAS